MPSDRYIPAAEAMTGQHLPQAPAGWPEAMQARLRAIVGPHPAGWWTPASEPLLFEYVRSIEMAERLQARIDALNVDTCDAQDLDLLLRARDRESKRALQLARSMRLAQQAIAPETAARALERGASADAPWLVDGKEPKN